MTLSIPQRERHEQFMRLYKLQLFNAEQLVSTKAQLGRNNFVGLPDMFPHAEQSCVDIVYMKSARISNTDDLKTIREELVDIINYAAFGLALIQGEEEGVL